MISLAEQTLEIELHVFGLRDLVTCAIEKKIKRPAEWVDRQTERLAAAEAALATLRGLETRA